MDPDPVDGYTQYRLDLDAEAASAGIALDSDVYIRFRHDNTLPPATQYMYLDDVRVVTRRPVVDLNGPDEAGTDFLAAFAPAGGPVFIVDDDMTVADADDTELVIATVTLTNPFDGTDELLTVDTTGTSIVATLIGGVLTLTGSDTLANYERVLRGLAYDNTSFNPDSTTRVVEVVVNDGSHDSNIAISRITLILPPAPTWHSAAMHDGGELLLEIADDGSFSEPRATGIRTLVLEFGRDVNLSDAAVVFAGDNGSPDGPNLVGITASVLRRDGDTGEILFSDPLPDDARYLVRIDGVKDMAGNPLVGDNDRVMTALMGDVNQDRKTDVFDLRHAWDYRGRAASDGADQARSDVNHDGTVSTSDMLLAWGYRGHDATGFADPLLSALGAASQGAEAPLQTYAMSPCEQIAGGISAATPNVQGLAASVVASPIPTNFRAASQLAASTVKPQASAALPDMSLATVGIVPAILAEPSSQAGLAPVATPALARLWPLPPSSDPSAPPAELELSLGVDMVGPLAEPLDTALAG